MQVGAKRACIETQRSRGRVLKIQQSLSTAHPWPWRERIDTIAVHSPGSVHTLGNVSRRSRPGMWFVGDINSCLYYTGCPCQTVYLCVVNSCIGCAPLDSVPAQLSRERARVWQSATPLGEESHTSEARSTHSNKLLQQTKGHISR